jgi:hypothetical protein
MKKTFYLSALIVLTLALAFSFSACSATPVEKRMTAAWGPYERLTYDVIEDGEIIGSYVSTIESIENIGGIPLKINGVQISFTAGYLIKTELTIGNTKCYGEVFIHKINNNQIFRPEASLFKKEVDGEITESTYIKYENGSAKVTAAKNGDTQNYDVKLKSVFFDNLSIYYVLRAMPFEEGAASLTFLVPLSDGSAAKMTASTSAAAPLSGIGASAYFSGAESVDAYLTSLSRSTFVPGVSYYVRFAKPNAAADGAEVKKAPLKIIENTVTYMLKEIKTSRG